MARTFVVINDPVHGMLRRLTRHTPLRPTVGTDGSLDLQYSISADLLPDSYFDLALLHRLYRGLREPVQTQHRTALQSDKNNVVARAGYFDAIRLDRRCCRDLRLKVSTCGPGLLAADLLTFGLGTLRARNDDTAERIHHFLWSHHGRIETGREKVFANIRALHRNSMLGLNRVQKESFDSTNIIYGDAFGEIEQLWERRADTAFLDQTAQVLARLNTRPRIVAGLHPPMNLDTVIGFHQRAQGIWKVPPANGRVLLRRIEAILEQAVIEDYPDTVYRWREPAAQPELGVKESDTRSWRPDKTGSDGWLTS